MRTHVFDSLQVVSLHPLGRQLRGCCAAAQGGRVLVFETHVGMSTSTNIQVWRGTGVRGLLCIWPCLEWGAH